MTGSFAPTARTKLAAVVGSPVRHSLSPVIHNAAFKSLDLDWSYVAFEVPPDRGGTIVEAMRTLGLAGVSVTMPHKQVVAETADAVTDTAKKLQSANTLAWDGDRIVADSTDGDGFVAAYGPSLGVDGFAGKSVAVVGAGGAAKSIVEALGRAGTESILVLNRSLERAEAAASLAPQASVADELAASEADVIVNTTPVGMGGGSHPNQSPISSELIRESHTVIDIVYHPAMTPLLVEASSRGATTLGGLAMLIHQASLQLEQWSGRSPHLETMANAASQELAKKNSET